ncbi:MAG: hypothetical protein U5K71_13230 [Gracilimonas sp.]|nr:hypothetical protein [Gracilimonas sp.]
MMISRGRVFPALREMDIRDQLYFWILFTRDIELAHELGADAIELHTGVLLPTHR